MGKSPFQQAMFDYHKPHTHHEASGGNHHQRRPVGSLKTCEDVGDGTMQIDI